MIGKMLVGEIFGSSCRLKGPDAMTRFMNLLHNAIGGQDTDKFPLSFFDRNRKYVQALLTANKRVNMDGKVIEAFCFRQILSAELQQALKVDASKSSQQTGSRLSWMRNYATKDNKFQWKLGLRRERVFESLPMLQSDNGTEGVFLRTR